MSTEFLEESYVSRDGAENGSDYEEEVSDFPDSLELDELCIDEKVSTKAGHGLEKIVLEGRIEGVEYRVNLIESGEPEKGSTARASPENDSVVYLGRLDQDPGELLEGGAFRDVELDRIY